MASLDDVKRMVATERGLAVVATVRPGGRAVAASVVNAGTVRHPVDGREVVAFVSAGRSRRLERLRRDPNITVVFRSGWEWVAVEGTAELCGPDDELDGVPASRVPQLLRDVFVGASGTHDDWETYDRVMAEERRAAVLIRPDRIYSNG
jgi:PPOX class probable F420-dependent enzyme